ncbi:putative ferric-chelate reductase 1 [Lates japonicus]|uniref:Ferric-chelate reductase 1 n=1 Tax=Lates japonicus TaxID=270547 RepID=A0AAD3RBZ4_LATJO|nr:putative ferric-chelate reductase 1 [Lates japonicus]
MKYKRTEQAQPSECDPSQEGSCFFLSARVQNGQNFDFGLSGESEGYIAATVSADDNVGNNDTTYVCAKNGTDVLFFGTYLNNGQLTKAVLNANSVKGRVNGNKIQCTFAATVSNAQTRATTVAIGISTGPFDSTSGTLGSPTLQLRSTGVDLGNPNATVTNQLSSTSTTAAPTVGTTNHAITFQQSLMQALLISVGMVGLGML